MQGHFQGAEERRWPNSKWQGQMVVVEADQKNMQYKGTVLPTPFPLCRQGTERKTVKSLPIDHAQHNRTVATLFDLRGTKTPSGVK